MSGENVFRLVAFVLLLVGFGISGFFRRRANRVGGERDFDVSDEKPWVRRVRVWSAVLGYGTMLAYLLYPPLVGWAQLQLPETLRWLGAALMLLMVPMIYWLFSSLGKNVTPTVSIRREHELVTHGPYRAIRHPLYTFGYINFVGMSLLAANWFMFAMLTIGMLALGARTRQEEENLIQRFGEQYLDYMKRTGRYLPKLG